jgi:predicted metalloprotease with PDZ domain
MSVENYENFDIEYTDADIEYIRFMIDSLLSKQDEIMSFFGITRLDKKVKIKMWDNLYEYRKYVNGMLKELNTTVPDWETARSTNNKNESRIDITSYKERLKCKGHQDDKLENIVKVPIHEFVHTCHSQYKNYERGLTWYSEALATILSS